MNHTINDSFMNPDRFGYAVMPFRLNSDREPPKRVPKWRIARTNAWERECMSIPNHANVDHCYAEFTITNVLIVGD